MHACGDTGTGFASDEDRRRLLAEAIQMQVIAGARIESRAEFQAVLICGREVLHIPHFLATAFLGIVAYSWGSMVVALVAVTSGALWLALALRGGEQRIVVRVDEFGNTSVQRPALRDRSNW